MAEIKNIVDLITQYNLVIPNYQRPYKWSNRNISDLLTDIGQAIEDCKQYGGDFRYRIGTILLHKEGDNRNIVDGQQRVISITLLCLYLGLLCGEPSILKSNFDNLDSQRNIRDNYHFIKQWFALKSDEDKDAFRNALRKTIEVVVIEVDDVAEAFQLFDSQNSRGKELYPHDLLKAYHLREMSDNLSEMEHAVEEWEDQSPEAIKRLYSDYLFPICRWIEKSGAERFTDKHIDLFKGSSITEGYTFANRAFKATPYYQINEPFIAGNDFFEYTKRYLVMYSDIVRKFESGGDNQLTIIEGYLNRNENRLKYCKQLFYSALLCYYDRFHRFDRMAIIRLFTWAYMIRCDISSLGFDTINKYAIGDATNAAYTNKIAMFSFIANARKHSDIGNMVIGYSREIKKNSNAQELREELLADLKRVNDPA